jgi:hypothetical protein
MPVMTADNQHVQRPTGREPIVGLNDKDISVQAAVGVRSLCVVEQVEQGSGGAATRVSQAAFGDGMTRESALLSVSGPRS